MNGEKNELCFQAERANFRGGLEAIHAGHADIGNDEIRIQSLRDFTQDVPVTYGSGNVMMPVEQGPELLDELRMIVREQNAFSFQGIDLRGKQGKNCGRRQRAPIATRTEPSPTETIWEDTRSCDYGKPELSLGYEAPLDSNFCQLGGCADAKFAHEPGTMELDCFD
jgi:hypothetical protein